MEPDNVVAEEEVTETESAETYIKAGTGYVDEDGVKQRLTAGFTFNPGQDLTEACELYGEEVVYQRYLRGVIKDGGNAIRSDLVKRLEAGEDPSGIETATSEGLKTWRPDVSRRPTSKKDPAENILANFANLSPEKQQEIIAELMEKAG